MLIYPPKKGEITKISFAVDGIPVDTKPIEIVCSDEKTWLKQMDEVISAFNDKKKIQELIPAPKPIIVPFEWGIDKKEILHYQEGYGIKDVKEKQNGYEVSFHHFRESFWIRNKSLLRLIKI